MVIDDKVIARINELYKKSKNEGLTEEEKAEQTELRNGYIQAFRNNLRGQLNTITIKNPDGTLVELKEKDKTRKNENK